MVRLTQFFITEDSLIPVGFNPTLVRLTLPPLFAARRDLGGFNPTLVRLTLVGDYRAREGDIIGFNPTLVRLTRDHAPPAYHSRRSFNPTLVRLTQGLSDRRRSR